MPFESFKSLGGRLAGRASRGASSSVSSDSAFILFCLEVGRPCGRASIRASNSMLSDSVCCCWFPGLDAAMDARPAGCPVWNFAFFLHSPTICASSPSLFLVCECATGFAMPSSTPNRAPPDSPCSRGAPPVLPQLSVQAAVAPPRLASPLLDHTCHLNGLIHLQTPKTGQISPIHLVEVLVAAYESPRIATSDSVPVFLQCSIGFKVFGEVVVYIQIHVLLGIEPKISPQLVHRNEAWLPEHRELNRRGEVVAILYRFEGSYEFVHY
nr:hypothetical protein Iba_chr15eCG0120 [Ipomoea batatas]